MKKVDTSCEKRAPNIERTEEVSKAFKELKIYLQISPPHSSYAWHITLHLSGCDQRMNQLSFDKRQCWYPKAYILHQYDTR